MPRLQTYLERRIRRSVRQFVRRAQRRLMPETHRRVVVVMETPRPETERSPEQLYSWAVAKIGFAP